jgi:uroporphyrinogen III methyltransferase/synthase
MTKVYLVGAGPGDPDLITVKGRRVLESAGAVLFDNLTPAALLALAPPHAERIWVGGSAQDEICAMLIERARRGWNVVRLMGGDPFLFERGGEEAEALAEAGVPFEIVPGVAAPLGIAACAGVPLTHRGHSQVVAFIAGQDAGAIDWDRLGMSATLVIYNGLAIFGEIARELMARGRDGGTPAMAVRCGTRPGQETLVGTLATLPAIVAERGMQPPATIVVGEVVRLRGKLNWFERRPLFGQRIVVTRSIGQAGALASRLEALGAEAIEMPMIEIQPAADYGPLDQAISQLSLYDWLIFTSANGVRAFVERMDRSAIDFRALRARICAIGPATRAAVEALHLKVDLMGTEYVAEGLLRAFAGHPLEGARILLPRAAVARDLVPVELRRRGAQVDVVEAYRTELPEDAAARAREVFGAGPKPGWIAFTSSSTVRNFVSVAPPGALAGVRVASIGPVTTRTARESGIEVAVEAREFTIDGLVEAILG